MQKPSFYTAWAQSCLSSQSYIFHSGLLLSCFYPEYSLPGGIKLPSNGADTAPAVIRSITVTCCSSFGAEGRPNRFPTASSFFRQDWLNLLLRAPGNEHGYRKPSDGRVTICYFGNFDFMDTSPNDRYRNLLDAQCALI